MKSLLISGGDFPPQVGGISRFMGSVARALGPTRVCCLTGVADSSTDNHFGPRVYRRPGLFSKTKYIRAVIWGVCLIQIMVRERPQVVQLATVYEGYLGLWLRRWLKLPFVVYAHGNEILHATQTDCPKPRHALQQADRVLANSRFTADLVQKAGVVPERIEVVYPGCDVERFCPKPARMDLRKKLLGNLYDGRVILTVGRLVARKGHDMVIRALPFVRQSISDIAYLIVGDGPYRTELETLAVATGVQDRVIFAGRVPAEELPDIYALSDVFVMPSRAQLDACDVEGFGMVFLEASACGKPVVGGRSGGISESVLEGVTGLLVNPHDPEDIAYALTHILSDRDRAADLGAQGRLRVIRDFGWPRVADRVQEILSSVVYEQGTRRPPQQSHRVVDNPE
jgi:phosphatidyl-myo-inositol dimannoside synthase